ncbi:MAG TPA: isomerase [Chloroflexi bacterium]|nr:isomerase [Chloroflexota bacterium]|tara:strand:- start:665 stop:1444 length:780 start_codon:yes stop_codon:yes gene_type:complete
MKIFYLDVFAKKLFEGNCAAVVPLDEWIDSAVMQSIAAENNLSETVFFVPYNDGYNIRWFTPLCEVDLCGHATLAAGYVIFNEYGHDGDSIKFKSKSGLLYVNRYVDLISLDMPAKESVKWEHSNGLADCLGAEYDEVLIGDDLLVVFKNEYSLANLDPDFGKMKSFPGRGVIVTAPSGYCDFVMRFFAPKLGINEDPATGSAFTQLGPYWGYRMAKSEMSASQLSKRGGTIYCEINKDRVIVAGNVIKYMEGSLNIEA